MLAESGQMNYIDRWPLPTTHSIQRPGRPCQWHPCSTVIEDLASCQMLAVFGIYRARTLIEILRHFQEAYGRAEKRFGDKHLMSYHNHVYHRKSTALFVCVCFDLLKHDLQLPTVIKTTVENLKQVRKKKDENHLTLLNANEAIKSSMSVKTL